jgi:hypothetical protein
VGSVVGLDIGFATGLNGSQHHGHSLNISVESNVHQLVQSSCHPPADNPQSICSAGPELLSISGTNIGGSSHAVKACNINVQEKSKNYIRNDNKLLNSNSSMKFIAE